MRGISYTDPEAERWRLGVLKETGQIANLGDIGEVCPTLFEFDDTFH